MLEIVEQKRQEVSRKLDPELKSSLGQFMTPAPVASFMAGLFTNLSCKKIKLLDAGAGMGSLTFAFLERWDSEKNKTAKVIIDAYEVDDALSTCLSENLRDYKKKSFKNSVNYQVINEDFIIDSARISWKPEFASYTHAILNPPYKKINSDSEHRTTLRSMGIETVNLYSAFVEVAINRMMPGGELVVIIPRSFCNGPYYKPFRKALLKKTAIKTIHLFDSRRKTFKDDGVLQENVILYLVKGDISKDILVSTSTDSSFIDRHSFKCNIKQIVNPTDEDQFIRVPASKMESAFESSESIKCGLKEIGVEVSTGPVVDFRSKENIHKMPLKGDAPLLYPAHFEGFFVKWPRENIRKANAIAVMDETKKMLFPKGYYVLIKRFSPKEEKKRICAVLLSPEDVHAESYGFENHLNVFHSQKNGLDEDLARGLMVFLNSSEVDVHFREFNGHTQVNATDLRSMKYPSADVLKILGKKAKPNGTVEQGKIDEMVKGIL